MTKSATTTTHTDAGTEAGKHLRAEAAKEERKIEAEKGSELKKGADRFEERAQSANGEGAEETQKE